MPHLIIHREGQPPLAFHLLPGRYRLGRTEDNDLVVADPTVSSHHCELEVQGQTLRLRDLGSTNGTFVDDQPVADAEVQPGRQVRFGSVPATWGSPDQVIVSKPGRAAAAGSAEASAVGSGATARMPTSAPVAHVSTRAAPRRRAPKPKSLPPDISFGAVLKGAWAYPLRGNGPVILIAATLFFWLLDLARGVGFFAGPIGVMGMGIAAIMSGGYLFSWMQAIILSSSYGELDPPELPEVTDFVEGFVVPCFRLVAIWVCLCGPGMVLMAAVSPGVGLPVLALGLFCFPMAMLTVALADSIVGLNPLVIFSGILKLFGPYVVTCLIFLVALAVRAATDRALELVSVPLLPSLLSTFVALYCVVVMTRALGLMYYTHKAELGWFH